MKKHLTVLATLGLIILINLKALPEVIHSTTTGGDWDDPASWQEGTVPGTNDDVVITGPGAMFVMSTGCHCNDLTVNTGALLRHKSNATRKLMVYGDIVNNGSITDTMASGYLYLSVYGDLENNGIWNNRRVYLKGVTGQSISCDTGQHFGLYDLIDSVSSSPVNVLTDIVFLNTDIDLLGATLNMNAAKGGTFTMHGGKISNADIRMNNGVFFQDNNAYLEGNVMIEDATLQGTVTVFASGNSFSGEIIVNGTLQNRINASANLYVDGNLTNNGVIANTNNSLNIYLTGNLVNNGNWGNKHTYLSGSNPHELSQGAGGVFSGENFHAETATGPITLATDFTFTGTDCDLNGDTLYFMSAADTLSFTNGYLIEGILNMNGGMLFMDGSAYISNCAVSDARIGGKMNVFASGVTFSGNTIVQDTMQNKINATANVTIHGSFTNNGVVQITNNNINFNVFADIINNGTWIAGSLNINDTNDVHIRCLNGNIFMADYVDKPDTIGRIVCNGDVSFFGTIIDLHGSTLWMEDGITFTLDGASYLDATLFNGKVGSSGAFYYRGTLNSYLHNIDIYSDVTLLGMINLMSSIHTYGELTVSDTLRNRYNATGFLTLHNRLVNNGRIEDGLNSRLYIESKYHIINNGDWVNYSTVLNGDEPQLIYLINGKTMDGTVIFDALSAGAPYQWYFEEQMLNSPDFSGEQANQLTWLVPVSPTYNGDFYCETAAGNSRNIAVRSGIIFDLTVLLEGPWNGSEMQTTLNQNGNIPLDQPFNSPPWNYNGDESVPAIPSADIVDWILVELRETAGGPETATPSTIVMQRAMFLGKDGRMLDMHGFPEGKFDYVSNQNIYMVVWHRNHLGVMTAQPPSFDIAPVVVDFTLNESAAFGGPLAHKNLGGGIYGMAGGDGNSDGQTGNNDKNDVWAVQAGTGGYLQGDFNLDAEANNSDKIDVWVINGGRASQVPQQ